MGFDMNYKIKVANEVGNREVQDLFRELGGEWGLRVDSDHYDKEFLYLTNGIIEYDDSISEFESVDECEEITLPELRDLVVLKRNDVGDASHRGTITDNVYYVSSDEEVYRFESLAWCFSTVIVADLKPIERKETKEYLIKINGAYKLCSLLEDDVTDEYIEIPEGDTWAYKNSRGNIITMHGNVCQAFIGDLVWERESMKENSITKEYLEKQPDGSYVMKAGFAFKDAGWIEIPEGMNYAYKDEFNVHFTTLEMGYRDSIVIWQRESPNDKLASAEQYRQAEVLPFIDDEPKSAWDTQVGGDHYKKYKIQPMEFALENNLNPLQHSVLKYVMRHEDKNGKQDLEKAKHYIDLMIEYYYGNS